MLGLTLPCMASHLDAQENIAAQRNMACACHQKIWDLNAKKQGLESSRAPSAYQIVGREGGLCHCHALQKREWQPQAVLLH